MNSITVNYWHLLEVFAITAVIPFCYINDICSFLVMAKTGYLARMSVSVTVLVADNSNGNDQDHDSKD